MGDIGVVLEELETEFEDKHPIEQLLDAARRAAAMTAVLGAMVGALRAESGVDIDGFGGMTGTDHLGDLRPHPLVGMYQGWIETQGRLTKLCLDAGIDERRIRINEAHASEMADVLRDVVGDLTAVLRGELRREAPGVAWPAIEAVLAREVGPAMGRALRKRDDSTTNMEAMSDDRGRGHEASGSAGGTRW